MYTLVTNTFSPPRDRHSPIYPVAMIELRTLSCYKVSSIVFPAIPLVFLILGDNSIPDQ